MDETKTDKLNNTNQDDTIEWDYAVPIFTNRFFYQDCILVCAFTLLVFASLFGILHLIYYLRYRQPIHIPVYSEYTIPAFVFFFAIIVLGGLIMFIVSKNRYLCHFVINREGVLITYIQDKGLLRFFGLFKPQSIIGKKKNTDSAKEHIFYAWDRIESAIAYPKINAIALYGIFMRVAVIFCPSDKYKEILVMVNNAIWRTEKKRRPLIEGTKKRFVNRLLWIVFLFIMALLGSEAPLMETDIPIWTLFVLSIIATIVRGSIRQVIGFINLSVITAISLFMIYKGLKIEYSGLGLFAYNFFRNLVHPDYLIFFILSLTGFVGFIVYSWVIIVTSSDNLHGHRPKSASSEIIIRSGLVLMFIIIVAIVYAVYWQAFHYEKAAESPPETIKHLIIYDRDSKETKEFKISYNAMVDALQTYHRAEERDKKRAYGEYKRLRRKVFEKKQKMIEAMGAKQKSKNGSP
ncbi:MAG: hypothetical protein N3D15_08635 [Syntrophorhabdaceae bacterium]|nr:hypothetical protein [Syntrophorhabdaceae bacterium]